MMYKSSEVLKAHQRHTKTLIDLLNEAKALASEQCDCTVLLDVARDGLSHVVSEIESTNLLAKALIQDSSTIECHIDQSEFLINAASAVLNILNAEIDRLSKEGQEAVMS